METINALELITAIGTETTTDGLEHPKKLNKSAFALSCACEQFEDVVDDGYKAVAEALRIISSRLFVLTKDDTLQLNAEILLNPDIAFNTYDKFLDIFICLNHLYEDFGSMNWRAQIAWRNVQDYTKTTRDLLAIKRLHDKRKCS